MSDAPRYMLEQPASRASALLSFAVFLPAACSIFVPFGMVAMHPSEALAAAREQPVATVQILLGALLWTALFIVPVYRRLKRHGLSRALIIRDGHVVETTKTLFGTHEHRLSLQHFRGIVHRVRTTVGGMHHELALIERQTERSVVFLTAPNLTRADVDAAVQALGLPELKAADLVALPPLFDAIRIAPLGRPASA